MITKTCYTAIFALVFFVAAVRCDSVRIDFRRSGDSTSNPAAVVPFADYVVVPPLPLATGTIIGIVIACIFALIVVAVILYIVFLADTDPQHFQIQAPPQANDTAGEASTDGSLTEAQSNSGKSHHNHGHSHSRTSQKSATAMSSFVREESHSVFTEEEEEFDEKQEEYCSEAEKPSGKYFF